MQTYKTNRLETTKLIGSMVDKHWSDLRSAKDRGEMVAWCSGPMFIFPYAMGMKCHFMAGYAAYAGGRGAADRLLELAEDEGDMLDTCSYHKAHMGMVAAIQKGLPLREDVKLPMPDLMITGRLCPEMSHYSESLYRRLNVEVLGVDTPPPAKESDVLMLEKFCETQIRETLIPGLEKACGKPFDYDKLSEFLAVLKETCILRNECWEYFKKIPSPWTLWDYGVSIAPVFYMMGSPEAVPYYTKLRDELAERSEKKIGAIEPERFRIYWDGWLPWGFLGQFSRKMTSLGIVPLVGRYPWEFFPHPETIDLNEDPVVTFTKQVYTNGGLAKQNMPGMSLPSLHKWVDEYHLDGVIMFSSKSCRMWNLGHPDFIKAIEKKNGIPGVVIEGDMVDSRMNSFAQIDTRLEALAEMMEARKKRP